MKRIKIIGTAYPFRGGLAAYNERLAKEFIKMGYEVEIETFTTQYPSFLFPGKSQYATWEKPELKIKRTINSINPFNWIKEGIRIKKEKNDLVIIKYWIPFMSPCFGVLSRIIRRNRVSKIICIADNIIPHEKRFGDNLLTGFFMNSIDGIVAMSKSVYNDIFKFRKNIPSQLSPHPLFDDFGEILSREQALEKLGLDSNFRYLLFFGFIRDYKGLDWLIEAFADKNLENIPVKLIVAGEFYTESKPYLDLIEKTGLTDRIILKTDFIANEDVNKFFCSADLIVQPYKSATQSGVTQIGYYFNKPMLVTDVGGLSEIISHNKAGYVVTPSKDAVAGAIHDFFSNNRRQEFEENTKIEKQKYLWGNMVNAILEVYNKTSEK